jgi:hypothetical protein
MNNPNGLGAVSHHQSLSVISGDQAKTAQKNLHHLEYQSQPVNDPKG